jgi:hypothetical protein
LPGLRPEIIQADILYETSLPFGIDEVSKEELRECAIIVADTVAREHINNTATAGEKKSKTETTCTQAKTTKSSCCGK